MTAFLLSLILFLGCGVCVLLAIWICRWEFPSVPPQPDTNVRRVSHEVPTDQELPFDEPKSEEILDLLEPTLQELIDSVSTVSVTAAMFQGAGTQSDDPRAPPKSALDGEDVVPPFERWQLEFAAENEREYAAQLDKLEIELGVFGGGKSGIDYVFDLSTSPSQRHNARPPTEVRLYFSWLPMGLGGVDSRHNLLAGFERRLVSRAGIAWQGRHFVKFIPIELENRLAQAELEYAQKHGYSSPSEIAKTVFQMNPDLGPYPFRVISQRYRKPKPESVFNRPGKT